MDKIKKLLEDPEVDPSFNDNEAIRVASMLGLDNVIQLLLHHEKVDPAARDNEAIRVAAGNGHLAAVQVLLASGKVNPGARNSEALRMPLSKYRNGSEQIVELLLKHPDVDPAANENEVVVNVAHHDLHNQK